MHGLDEYDSEARWYYPAIMRTTTMDPLCEKYYSTSPYAWCGNNPVNIIDPDGRDDYRYDSESGSFICMKQTSEKFDRIGKYSYNQDSGEYEQVVDRHGNAIYYGGRSNHIAKGILSDNMNFRDKALELSFGGKGEPSRYDIFNFVYLVDKELALCEISGFEVNDHGKDKVLLMPYKDNIKNRSYTPLQLVPSDYVVKSFFHSHGQASEKEANKPSIDIDIPARDQIFKYFPNNGFIIEFLIIYGNDKQVNY